MTKEQLLKEYILSKYKSMRQFTEECGIPYSTMSTILKRGIDNSNVNNIIKICQFLEISTDELAAGNIVPSAKSEQEIYKIEDILDNAKQQLLTSDHLLIDEHAATTEDIIFVVSALDNALEMRKNQLKRLAAYHKKLKKDDK